jgi:hypothetical protein
VLPIVNENTPPPRIRVACDQLAGAGRCTLLLLMTDQPACSTPSARMQMPA